SHPRAAAAPPGGLAPPPPPGQGPARRAGGPSPTIHCHIPSPCPGMWRLAPACPRLVKKLSLRAHRAIQSARLQRSETPVSTAVPEKVLVRSVLLAGARTLGSGRWVKGLHEATARRAALDAVAASRTIGAEKTVACRTGLRRLSASRFARLTGVARRVPGGPLNGRARR